MLRRAADTVYTLAVHMLRTINRGMEGLVTNTPALIRNTVQQAAARQMGPQAASAPASAQLQPPAQVAQAGREQAREQARGQAPGGEEHQQTKGEAKEAKQAAKQAAKEVGATAVVPRGTWDEARA